MRRSLVDRRPSLGIDHVRFTRRRECHGRVARSSHRMHRVRCTAAVHGSSSAPMPGRRSPEPTGDPSPAGHGPSAVTGQRGDLPEQGSSAAGDHELPASGARAAGCADADLDRARTGRVCSQASADGARVETPWGVGVPAPSERSPPALPSLCTRSAARDVGPPGSGAILDVSAARRRRRGPRRTGTDPGAGRATRGWMSDRLLGRGPRFRECLTAKRRS
jgi:hypothetical protein